MAGVGKQGRNSKSPMSRLIQTANDSESHQFSANPASVDFNSSSKDSFSVYFSSRLQQVQERERFIQFTQQQKLSAEERHRQQEAASAALELAQQIKSDEERAASKARWDKKVAKLKSTLQPAEYYANLPIKPGFFFLQSLILAPRGLLKTLKINVPDTLYLGNRLWLLYTGEGGTLQCDDSFTCVDFLKRIETQREVEPKHAFDYIAVVLRRRGSTELEVHKHLLDWTQFRNKMLLRDIVEGCMLQKFIRSVGGKASAIRLKFHPHASDNKANTAYFLSNIQSEKSEHFYKCVVNVEAVDSFELFKLRGSAIKEVEFYAKSIVEYLNRGYSVRIKEIHLDFLKDEDGVLWLCGCRGFLLDAISVPRSVSPVAKQSPTDREIQEQETEDRRRGRFVRCKLCRLHYQNQELPHLISVRMLFVYKTHVTKRVDLPLNVDHLKLVTPDLLSQSVRICELCFMLITSEFRLIEAEKQLAEAVSIAPKEDALEDDPAHIMQLQFLPKKLVQWRVLFYFRSIDRPDFLRRTDNLRLSISVYGCSSEFETVPGLREIKVNKLKLIYFFASADKSIRNFLNETVLKFTLWREGERVATGSSMILYHFPSSLPMGMALTQSRVLSLFSANSAAFDLTLTVGLSCDRLYHSKYLKVNLTKVHDVYLPESHYYNGTPLPVDWMEQFGEQHVETSFKAEITPEDFYESTISKEELRRMRTRKEANSSRSLSRSKSRSRTPGLPPISYKAASALRKDVPSLDLSAVGTNNDQTVKDLLCTVNGYLRDRPKSALSESLQDRSQSISKTARTVTIEVLPKSRRRSSRRCRKSEKSNSSLSTRFVSPSPSLKSFREHYRDIAKCVGEDLKAYGGHKERKEKTMQWMESEGEEFSR